MRCWLLKQPGWLLLPLLACICTCPLCAHPPSSDGMPTPAAVLVTVPVPVTIVAPVTAMEVAASKPTTASGFWRHADLSFPPRGIVDRRTDEAGPCVNGGHNTQYWLLPDGQIGWVQVDLLQNYDIVRIRWLNTYNGRCGGDRATTRFHIALSLTGAFREEAQIVYWGEMEYSPSPTYGEVILSPPVPARYVRFYVDEYYGWGGGLNELEVYAILP